MPDTTRPRAPRSVLIVGKRDSGRALAALRRVARLAEGSGLRVMFEARTARALGRRPARAPGRADLCVVLGGDGTLLAAVRALAGRPVPVLGINLGGLGFMTETTPDETDEVLAEVLRGRYETSRRMTLDAALLRRGRVVARDAVLNDVVIAKSALARMVELRVTIDRRMVTVYRADGLIVSTPTGSTAYSLSAGGPIVHPEMDALLITPICPHTLTMRPLVVPAESTVEVTLVTRDSEVYLTLDGQVGHPLRADDRVRVRRGAHPALMVRSRRRDSYEILRRKLRWGEL